MELLGWGKRGRQPHLDLAFPHEPVCALAVFFGNLCFVVTLFVAQYPQGLGAFQLYLKLLWPRERRKVAGEQIGVSVWWSVALGAEGDLSHSF